MPDNKHSPADYAQEFDSPFLSEELFGRDREEEWEPRAAALASESPFLSAFERGHERFDSPEAEGPRSFDEAPFREGEDGVIDGENRVRVTPTVGVPWRWICRVDVKGNRETQPDGGTGVLVSDRHVLTAAHVVYEAAQNMQNFSIQVIPALDYGDQPFGSYSVTAKPRLPRNYDPSAANHQDWDYALLKLNTAVGKETFRKLRGSALCFWGSPQCGANSEFARLDPTVLNGRAVLTAGYPRSEGAKKMMCAAGIIHSAFRLRRLMNITADTTKGQSGSPVWIVENGRTRLVGIASSAGLRSNRVVRVTRELIRQLRAWVTEDGETPYMVETEGESASSAAAVPYPEAEHYARPFNGWTPEPSAEGAEDFAGPDDEGQQTELLYERALEERYDPAAVPQDVDAALLKQNWALALKLAIQAGWRNVSDLTDLIFYAKLKLPQQKLNPNDPGYAKLSDEWTKIFVTEVWAAIQASAERADLAVSGKEAAEHQTYFLGKNGKRLKNLAEEVAGKVGINPGFIGMSMVVESHGKPHIFLLNEKVKTYDFGADDFYEARGEIAKRVPAYARIGWDRNQTPEIHDNDSEACTKKAAAQTAGDDAAYAEYSKHCRQVKTISVNSGRDAALALAAYIKYYETVVREDVATLNGDFDALPIEIRLGLTRMAMHTGRGGVAPRIREALARKDIFIRSALPIKIHQVQRNATVRIAQAMHLSDWVFGIPLQAAAAAQPELETFEGPGDEEFEGDKFSRDEFEGAESGDDTEASDAT